MNAEREAFLLAVGVWAVIGAIRRAITKPATHETGVRSVVMLFVGVVAFYLRFAG